MYKFTYLDYSTLSERILEQINQSDYFSGVVEINSGSTTIKLTASLIFYTDKVRFTNNTEFQINNIVPVWIEVVTSCEIDELENDFDFKIFKKILSKCE